VTGDGRPSALERARQTRRLLAAEGVEGVAQRLRTRLAERLAPAGSAPLELTRQDLARAAEAAAAGPAAPLPIPADGRLRIAWICSAPAPGSGGHTTMFRMVAALERAGHVCTVYLVDRHGWELDQHVRTIRRWWPDVRAAVRGFDAGVADAHAIFATSWTSAYQALGSSARGTRMYFVQDYEPAFHPAGSESLMAEATYDFGFHGVTAGRWLALLLRDRFGMTAEPFDFGVDLDSYALGDAAGARNGICYYCRPSTPRRAHELAVAALDRFATLHPDVDIHAYGEPMGRVPFRVVEHGLQTPAQLGELYRRCVAGLVLSATNVSLVPHELLAAGCIPVINEAEHNRVVLANDHVAYAPPTPFDLAAALSDLVTQPTAVLAARSAAAAATVRSASWEAAGATVTTIVERAVAAAAQPQALGA
jgi:glycosyltransferase involved in cell wall biosynthesis